MICRNCSKEINQRTKQLSNGYIDQCDNCSTEDVEKYVGRRTDKHGDTIIFRIDIDSIQRQIKRENAVGFNANLPFETADRDTKVKRK